MCACDTLTLHYGKTRFITKSFGNKNSCDSLHYSLSNSLRTLRDDIRINSTTCNYDRCPRETHTLQMKCNTVFVKLELAPFFDDNIKYFVCEFFRRKFHYNMQHSFTTTLSYNPIARNKMAALIYNRAYQYGKPTDVRISVNQLST